MNLLKKICSIIKTGTRETVTKRNIIALLIPVVACGGFATWAVLEQRKQDEQYLLDHPEECPEKEHNKPILREVWELLDGEQLVARLIWAILFAIAASGVREEVILPYLRQKRNN